MIDQEVKNGIPSHRIILGGFSQVMIFMFLRMERLLILKDLLNIPTYYLL